MGEPSRAERRARLAAARLYLCTDSRAGQGDLPEFLEAVLSGGVDVVQLRQKGLEAADELALLDVVGRACRRHGALLAVNDRADVAHAAGADVLHLGQRDLPPAAARALLGDGILLGRSSHDSQQAEGARTDPDLDYYCIGPVWPTPTKPGRPAAGLQAVREVAAAARGADAAGADETGADETETGADETGAGADETGAGADETGAGAGRPWFAIGGIDEDRLGEVLAAGADRVVVVRALTGAPDPVAAHAAALRLSTRLQAASRHPSHQAGDVFTRNC